MWVMPLIVLGLAIGAIWLQVCAVKRWQGAWRWLAAAPLIVAGLDLLWIIASVSIDPTSHNLWPLELLLVIVCGTVAVGALWLLRMVVRA